MSYLYLILATILFSLVGSLVKIASAWVPASAITFARFFFGSATILFICLIARRKPKLTFRSKWIWFAVFGKCLNYLTENYALQAGFSFGNIITFPVQALLLCFFSTLLFKEKIGPRKIIATLLCVGGILIISWNGQNMNIFVGNALPILILFLFSGIGAAVFVLSQKMLIRDLPATDMNLSVFLMSSLITFVPMAANFGSFQGFRFSSLLALIGLGAITGGAFLLVARSLKKVSLVVAGLIQNSSSLFTLLWAMLFWNEPVTAYVVTGTLLFLTGLLFLSIAPRKGAFKN